MIYTNYVWTELMEAQCVKQNVKETILAGFPAVHHYRPLENFPLVRKEWLNAGYIKMTDTPLPFLQFNWMRGNSSAGYEMATVFSENHIKWEWNGYGELFAAIGDHNKMSRVEYYCVSGNLYGITVKPRTTRDYFCLTPEELVERDQDGHTREERLLCENLQEHHIDSVPGISLYEALRTGEDYRKQGYEDIEVLQLYNGGYSVVCH